MAICTGHEFPIVCVDVNASNGIVASGSLGNLFVSVDTQIHHLMPKLNMLVCDNDIFSVELSVYRHLTRCKPGM